MKRKSLMSSITMALHAVNPFSSNQDNPTSNPKRKARKVVSTQHFAKPVPKSSFKQNQRKQRKASARKKAKR